jgi:hypothetical protein
MSSTRVVRLLEALEQRGIDHVLLSLFASLTYFTGYIPPVEFGPSPFTPVMGMLLCVRNDQPVFFLAVMEPTEDVNPAFALKAFMSYTVDSPLRHR